MTYYLMKGDYVDKPLTVRGILYHGIGEAHGTIKFPKLIHELCRRANVPEWEGDYLDIGTSVPFNIETMTKYKERFERLRADVVVNRVVANDRVANLLASSDFRSQLNELAHGESLCDEDIEGAVRRVRSTFSLSEEDAEALISLFNA